LKIFAPAIAFLKYYKIFHRYIGHKTLYLVGLSLATTLTEGLGIAIFFSYLQQLAGAQGATSSPNPVTQYLFSFLTWCGLPTTPLYVIGAMLVVFLIRGASTLVTNSFQYYLFQDLTKKITTHLVDSIASMNYREYLKNNSGHFTHLVTKEINRTVLSYYQISALIPKGVAVAIYLLLSIRIEWRFTILAVVFGLAITSIFRWVTILIRQHSIKLSETEAKLTGLVIQMIHSFKYLFATSSADHLRVQIDSHTKRAAWYGSRIGLLAAINPATSEPLIVAFISACIYYKIEVMKGDIASLFIVIMFLYRVMRESTVMQGSFQTFMSFSGSVDQVVECINTLSATRENPGGEKITRINDGFELRKVSFAYGEKSVLSDINLKIPARSMVGFVGESGSGKSTLIDLISAVLEPSSGSILVDGIDLRELDKKTYRGHLGYVTQEGVLFDDTIANNVSLWRLASDPNGEKMVWKALEQANCAEFVSALPKGIHEQIGDRGIRLSGGQRQRICIARELYKQINVLFLDEATSALDSESEKLVQASVDSLKGKTTVLIIAHRLSTIRHCDIICVMSKGKIVESGSFAELSNRNGHFRKMLDMQSFADSAATVEA